MFVAHRRGDTNIGIINQSAEPLLVAHALTVVQIAAATPRYSSG